MKLLTNTFLIVLNLVWNTLFFRILLRRNPEIIENGLLNILSDIEKLRIPIDSISLFFIPLLISIVVTIFTYNSIFKKLNLDDLINIFNTFLKLFIVNTGTLFFILYFFRLFNISRLYLLLNIFVYPFIFIFLLMFLKTFNKNLSKKPIFIIILILLISLILTFFLVNRLDSNTTSVESENEAPTSTITTLAFIEGESIGGDYNCYEWSGSDNFNKCVSGIEVTNLLKFESRLTNIINFNDESYILTNEGLVYKYSNGDSILYFDISEKVGVFEDFFESGFFSIAFHPTDDFFLVSYSDKINNLVVEKYQIKDSKPILDSSELLLTIPNSQCCHYSGSMIWSDYFEDFIISIGDMEDNTVPLLNSEPFDTTSLRGKIILLDTFVSNPKLISSTDTYEPRKNLLAYGLRNPWKTYEYEGILFVPDVGLKLQEELNIVSLDDFSTTKEPYLFGWPHFEGTLNNEVEFNEVLLWDGTTSYKINSFIEKESIKPVVYYNHQSPENFRAAIIGGEVISNPSSNYFGTYIFADYISKEIFSYDYKNNLLTQFPLPDSFQSYVTSIGIHPTKVNSILITTGDGRLVEVMLPNEN
tara:strand:- start:9740 stop:11500 length:1761 start_codon:yes stop_codon:yes gene_type:complete